MRMLDLFSGIGGFALAAEWTWCDELDIVGFCEIEEYPQKVLQKNFPGVPIHEDIKELNGNDFKNIDIITGGFPCQDISIAGKGEGIEGSRSGLWTEMHRIISEVRPRYAIIENVPMLTIRGETRVIADLAEIGYDCEWQIIGADEVGAWHRRKRIWIVAYSIVHGTQSSIRKTVSKRRNSEISDFKSGGRSKRRNTVLRTSENETADVPNTTKDVRDSERTGLKSGIHGQRKEQFGRTDTRGRECGGEWWAVEPELGRVANGIPNRVDRLKGLGNAIVPQVAYEIMRRIKDNA